MSDQPSRFAGYRRDYFLMVCSAGALALLAAAMFGIFPMDSPLGRAAHTVHEMLAIMWWGILLAIVVIGILDQIPQEFIVALLGRPGTALICSLTSRPTPTSSLPKWPAIVCCGAMPSS